MEFTQLTHWSVYEQNPNSLIVTCILNLLMHLGEDNSSVVISVVSSKMVYTLFTCKHTLWPRKGSIGSENLKPQFNDQKRWTTWLFASVAAVAAALFVLSSQ